MAGANVGPSVQQPPSIYLPQYYVVAVMLPLLQGYHLGQRFLFLIGTEEVTATHYLNQQLLLR